MTLKHTVILALILLPSSARPACETEADKARSAILSSGPFQYKSKQWIGDFERTRTGYIVPNKAEHVVEMAENDWRSKKEIIVIDKQGWTKGSFGWQPQPSLALFLRYKPAMPGDSYVTDTKCLGTVVAGDKSLTAYEQSTRFDYASYVERTFVEPGSGLTVRYEKVLTSGFGFNIVILIATMQQLRLSLQRWT